MTERKQTLNSFKDKWEQNPSLAFEHTLEEGSELFNWILNRNGFEGKSELSNWLSKKTKILDAGCGNGRVTALLQAYSMESAEIVGFDLTSSEVAKSNLSGLDNISIHKKDLLEDLSDLGRFDLIYCQEVLHHTTDPERAFINLTESLADSGEIAIYVYKKKAPMREFADDFIRDKISDLSYDKAQNEMQGLAKLGKNLSGLDAKFYSPAIDLLGIPEGEYDVQRFLYHFFLKCFWNDALSDKENTDINYDWYHPQLCSRHTEEEIESWFKNAKLKIIHRHVDHYGITFRGLKQ
tara:strand:- start:1630 stop:2511 length:882 start_codon:yes stop_codon:yes gene_type:complete